MQDLKQQQQQIEQERSHLMQQQNRLNSQEQSARKRLGGLQSNLKATHQQIAQNEAQIATANQQLKALEARLAVAEKSYAVEQTSTVARLRFLQQQQVKQGWAVLLQSQNLNDFLDRRYQLQRLYERDRTILSKLQAGAKQLKTRRETVETQRNSIALLTQELMAQKETYQAESQYQQGLINRLRQNRSALEAAELQLSRDSASIAVLIQQHLGVSNKTILRGSGYMNLPSDGPITSGFGDRIHPILGYSRFHSGLDFGADYGSPIYVADAGIVIFAGWYGGYGQAAIVDHGNNTTTLYAHASELYVSEGQAVQRGQVIGEVGSSGLSTGPHLHFEVRASGEPVDPSNYL